MSGFDFCLITNRRLCPEELTQRVGRVLSAGFTQVMLREKDLPEAELESLAGRLALTAKREQAGLIVNSSLRAAETSAAQGLQLPFPLFLELKNSPRLKFFEVGVSIHSLEEALAAQAAGAHRLVAGNIFETTCKPGLKARGIEFLSLLTGHIKIPIWAVGGLTPDHAALVRKHGASGLCVMSSLMTGHDPEREAADYIKTAGR